MLHDVDIKGVFITGLQQCQCMTIENQFSFFILSVNNLQYSNMSYSTAYSTASDRKSNRQLPSKVLLVCVYQTIIFELTNEAIFEKFNPFGGITKILIFQKGEVTKFFIEYHASNMAYNAKSTLDGTKFFQNICKMNIYFSNFNNVDLKHESTQGADYEAIEEKTSSFIQNFDNLSKSSQEINLNFLDDDMLMQTFLPFGSNNSFSRSKTDNPRTIEAQIMKMQSSQKFYMIEEEQVDRQIKNEIHNLLQEEDNLKDDRSQFSINTCTKSQKSLSLVRSKIQGGSVNHNCVISYDLKEVVPLRQIYNLFSNFGNIECIITKKQKIFIKFRSGYFAAVAMNYLSGLSFCGNHLNLNYSLNPQEFEQKPLQFSQSMYFEESCDRFTPRRSITVNPPSETLHVSSIKKDNCNESSLRKIFGIYGNVEKVKILMQSNQKNMALVKFSTLRQSFEAISDLHNKQFGGRKMQISFTKSKL